VIFTQSALLGRVLFQVRILAVLCLKLRKEFRQHEIFFLYILRTEKKGLYYAGIPFSHFKSDILCQSLWGGLLALISGKITRLEILNSCGESDQLIVNYSFAKNG